MREMRIVPEQKLQGMLPRRKIDGRLRLSPTEMTVVVVCRDWLANVGQWGI